MKHDSHAPVLHVGVPNPIFEGDLNVYVVAGDPLTLIDTGIGTPEGLEALEAGLASHGVALADVRQVLLTHKHADHIGLAADIRERSGATVYVHEDDWPGVGDLDRRHGEYLPLVHERLQRCRVPQEEIDKLARFLGHGKRFARQTEAQKIKDGDRFEISGQTLEVIHTPGHTQGSVSFLYGSHLFTGDHVLPTISPNIGAGELRRTGMMQRYLDALERIAKYQTDDLVALPGHGPAFSNLAERCTVLAQHHHDREKKILAVLAASERPLTIYEVASELWSKLPGFHIMLGISEVLSHLEKSITNGRVAEDDGHFRLM